MTDEEKGSSDVKYDRVALTEAVDWMDDPSEEAEDQELDNNNSNNNNNNNSGAAQDEDDDEDDEGSRFQDELTSHGTTSPSTSCWTTCFLPDDRFSICDTHFVDGPVAVKLLKFLAVTFGGICLMYKFVRFMVRDKTAATTTTTYRSPAQQVTFSPASHSVVLPFLCGLLVCFFFIFFFFSGVTSCCLFSNKGRTGSTSNRLPWKSFGRMNPPKSSAMPLYSL